MLYIGVSLSLLAVVVEVQQHRLVETLLRLLEDLRHLLLQASEGLPSRRRRGQQVGVYKLV